MSVESYVVAPRRRRQRASRQRPGIYVGVAAIAVQMVSKIRHWRVQGSFSTPAALSIFNGICLCPAGSALIFGSVEGLLTSMNLLDLTPQQLKRAATIKEQIQALSKELSQILGESSKAKTVTPARKRLSTAARRKIAAAQQARWAKFRAGKKSAGASAPKAKKKTMSSAAKSKLSARMKAYWEAKRSGKK